MLAELKQRIREVKPGPDGYLYALTDETFGAILRIEPGSSGSAVGWHSGAGLKPGP